VLRFFISPGLLIPFPICAQLIYSLTEKWDDCSKVKKKAQKHKNTKAQNTKAQKERVNSTS
jgi:hypothetical protein